MADEIKKAEPTSISTPSSPVTGTATVSVALKHPHGIVMQGYTMMDSGEATPQGYKVIKVAQATGGRFVLRGNSVAVQDIVAGRMPDHVITGGAYGYAITEGVPLDVYRSWWEANKPSSMLIRNRLVGPPPDQAGDSLRARAWVAEQGATRSGLEPLDPENPGIHDAAMRGVIEKGEREAA